MTIARSALLTVALVAVLAVASEAAAGGISDETCPNVAGEHTNTCPAGTVGAPYSIRFTESEGSGCGPGRQTFHLKAAGALVYLPQNDARDVRDARTGSSTSSGF